MAVAGRNPGRILGSLLGAFVRAHIDGRVRIVSEVVWPERTDEEYPACVEHEALVNVALADTAAHVLCPYDAAHLPPSVMSDATRTHPTLIRDGARCDSPAYADSHATAASVDRPLTPPPDEAEIVVVNTITGPRTVRRVAHRFGERAGLPPERLEDLTIAVHELAVNTILHSGGAGLMSIWAADHHVVVQIDDGGHIADPLVGRRPPGPSEVGHGLAVVHQVADLVRVHRTGRGHDSARLVPAHLTPSLLRDGPVDPVQQVLQRALELRARVVLGQHRLQPLQVGVFLQRRRPGRRSGRRSRPRRAAPPRARSARRGRWPRAAGARAGSC